MSTALVPLGAPTFERDPTIDPTPWEPDPGQHFRSPVIVEAQQTRVRIRCRCSKPLALFPRSLEFDEDNLRRMFDRVVLPHYSSCPVFRFLLEERREERLAFVQRQQYMQATRIFGGNIFNGNNATFVFNFTQTGR